MTIVAETQNMLEALNKYKAEMAKEFGLGDDATINMDELIQTYEEINLDENKFADNKLTTADWETLVKECPACIAFSCAKCELTTIETPKEALEQIEVMDISNNKLTDFNFVSGFPKLISLTMKNVPMTSLDELKPLDQIKTLRVMEFESDLHTKLTPALESEEALRAKVFEMFPEMLGVNGYNSKGEALEEDFGLLEEEGFTSEEEDEDVDAEIEGEAENAEAEETNEPSPKKRKVAEE